MISPIATNYLTGENTNGWTPINKETCDKVYDIHINGVQMDLIHCAMAAYLHAHKNQMSPGELEEVEALVAMSDFKGTEPPSPLPMCNGWVL